MEIKKKKNNNNNNKNIKNQWGAMKARLLLYLHDGFFSLMLSHIKLCLCSWVRINRKKHKHVNRLQENKDKKKRSPPSSTISASLVQFVDEQMNMVSDKHDEWVAENKDVH